MSATFTAAVAGRLLALIGRGTDGAAFSGPVPGIASIMAAALAVVFLVAAATKLSAPARTVTEFRQLGIPAAGPMARIVPALEAMVALGLVLQPALGALAAFGMLSAFTAVLVLTIRSGRTVSCGCLGAISSKPVNAATVARNGVLLAMASVAATNSSLIMPDLASVMISALLALVATLTVQLLALRLEIGRIWSVELAGEAGRLDPAAGSNHDWVQA